MPTTENRGCVHGFVGECVLCELAATQAINADLSEALRVAREEGEEARERWRVCTRDLSDAYDEAHAMRKRLDEATARGLALAAESNIAERERDDVRARLAEARELLVDARSPARLQNQPTAIWQDWVDRRDAVCAADAPKDAAPAPTSAFADAMDLLETWYSQATVESPPMVAAPEVATLAHGQSKQPVAPPTPGPTRPAPDLSALAKGEPCTCGSGLHPRRCVIHPERYQQHCDEISAENADVPAKECELCEVCGSEWGHFVMCGATEEYRVALSKRRMALARSMSDRPLRPSTATACPVVGCRISCAHDHGENDPPHLAKGTATKGGETK